MGHIHTYLLTPLDAQDDDWVVFLAVLQQLKLTQEVGWDVRLQDRYTDSTDPLPSHTNLNPSTTPQSISTTVVSEPVC